MSGDGPLQPELLTRIALLLTSRWTDDWDRLTSLGFAVSGVGGCHVHADLVAFGLASKEFRAITRTSAVVRRHLTLNGSEDENIILGLARYPRWCLDRAVLSSMLVIAKSVGHCTPWAVHHLLHKLYKLGGRKWPYLETLTCLIRELSPDPTIGYADELTLERIFAGSESFVRKLGVTLYELYFFFGDEDSLADHLPTLWSVYANDQAEARTVARLLNISFRNQAMMEVIREEILIKCEHLARGVLRVAMEYVDVRPDQHALWEEWFPDMRDVLFRRAVVDAGEFMHFGYLGTLAGRTLLRMAHANREGDDINYDARQSDMEFMLNYIDASREEILLNIGFAIEGDPLCHRFIDPFLMIRDEDARTLIGRLLSPTDLLPLMQESPEAFVLLFPLISPISSHITDLSLVMRVLHELRSRVVTNHDSWLAAIRVCIDMVVVLPVCSESR
jgi:hypothetical protein